MSHKIGRREAIDRAIWRLLREDLQKARADLRSGGSRDVRVHRARQRLKRARSLTRVLEPVIGPAAVEVRHELSAAARLLAGARDADAAVARARELKETAGEADDAGFGRVVAELGRRAEEAHRQGTPVADVMRRLTAAEARVVALSEDSGGSDLFATALVRSYSRGRKAMRRAEARLATPDLHKWRKRVKELWHLLRLGRKRLPRRLGKTAHGLARLGDLLGIDHDHAMLAEKLALSPEADPALTRQLSIIAGKRRKLEAEAFAIGRRLYRRKPKAFARRARLH